MPEPTPRSPEARLLVAFASSFPASVASLKSRLAHLLPEGVRISPGIPDEPSIGPGGAAVKRFIEDRTLTLTAHRALIARESEAVNLFGP